MKHNAHESYNIESTLVAMILTFSSKTFFLSLIRNLYTNSHFPALSTLIKKHSTTPLPSIKILNLLSGCRKIKDLEPLKSQLIVRGLFQHQAFIGKFVKECFDLGAPQLAFSTFQVVATPSLFLQNLMIRFLCDHFLYDQVLDVYQQCRSSGCTSDNYTFPFVIKACSSLSDFRIGKEVHSVVLRSGFGFNLVVQTALVDFYLKIGEAGSARVLHDKITQPDLVSWNALISGYSLHGLNQDAFKVFMEIIVKGLKPNVSTLASIIPVCSRLGNLDIAKSLHGFVIKCGFFMDEFLMPALISMYASDGDLSVAGDMFDCLKEKNVVTWNAMISAYTQSHKPYSAIELFQEMPREGVRPNMVTFVSLVPACEKIGNLGYGESVHACAINLGLANQLAVSTVLLSMYAKLGDLNSAKFLFDQMTSRNLLIWNSMVSGYTHNGHWTGSLAAFHDMQAAGISPDAISIMSILSSCSKLEVTLLGRSAHSFCLRKGFDLNLNVSNALLAFYSDCRQIRSSFNLFHRMVTRNTISWNTMISGCVHNGEDTNALLYLQQMQKEVVKFDLVTLVSILPCYDKPENLVQGMTVHAYAIKTGFSHDASIANALISMYTNSGELDAGKVIFENISNRNVVSWNALMTGYRCLGLQYEVILMFHQMIMEGHRPDHVTVLNVLPVLPNHKLGQSVHAYAARTGILLETPLLASLILMYGRFENTDSCNLLFEMGEKRNISLWNTVIAAYIQSKNAKVAMQLFSDLLDMKMEPDHITILSLTSICIQLNDMHLSNCIMGYIIRKGFDKDVAISNALIDLYARSGNISSSIKLFDSLIQKDAISWNVMINGYGLNGDGMSALAMLGQMRVSGLKPDKSTFVSLLSACSHTGLVKEGLIGFNSMVEQGILPEIEHYACIVDLLGRTGHLNEAYDIVKSLQQRPPVSLLESLLASCLSHGNVELGEEVGRLILEMEPKSSGPYVMLHNVYAAADKWMDADRVRSYMEVKSVKKLPGFSLVEESAS